MNKVTALKMTFKKDRRLYKRRSFSVTSMILYLLFKYIYAKI